MTGVQTCALPIFSAGDLVLIESSRYLTLSDSDSPDFMRMVRSILFIKSCGSWSSGLPVKKMGTGSDISSSSSEAISVCGDGVLW